MVYIQKLHVPAAADIQFSREAAISQIDKTEAEIGEAAAKDMQLWGISKFNHAKEVENLKTWLQERFVYLDTVIRAYPETAY